MNFIHSLFLLRPNFFFHYHVKQYEIAEAIGLTVETVHPAEAFTRHATRMRDVAHGTVQLLAYLETLAAFGTLIHPRWAWKPAVRGLSSERYP